MHENFREPFTLQYLQLEADTIPGTYTWAPRNTALPHWAPTTASHCCFFMFFLVKKREII